jgi:dolichol-phosphate mannosyltransferase
MIRSRRPWLQFGRFAIVGASGYAVNLATFTVLVHAAALDYRVCAVAAFLTAVTNNFVWNRRWTFRLRGGGRIGHARRFLCVSVGAFGVNLAVLSILVEVLDVSAVTGQAAAILAATPASFLGNKLWTFKP